MGPRPTFVITGCASAGVHLAPRTYHIYRPHADPNGWLMHQMMAETIYVILPPRYLVTTAEMARSLQRYGVVVTEISLAGGELLTSYYSPLTSYPFLSLPG